MACHCALLERCAFNKIAGYLLELNTWRRRDKITPNNWCSLWQVQLRAFQCMVWISMKMSRYFITCARVQQFVSCSVFACSHSYKIYGVVSHVWCSYPWLVCCKKIISLVWAPLSLLYILSIICSITRHSPRGWHSNISCTLIFVLGQSANN